MEAVAWHEVISSVWKFMLLPILGLGLVASNF